MKKKKLPAEANQRAKSIVDMTTGNLKQKEGEKNPAAVALGRRGGLVGGKMRAEALSPEARSEIARKAAAARWSKKRDEDEH